MIKMKIPFRMKSEECTTVASRVAIGSKILESCGCKSKDVKKLCRAAKDSAKDFDKAFCKAHKEYEKMKKCVEAMLAKSDSMEKTIKDGEDEYKVDVFIEAIKEALGNVESVFQHERELKSKE